MRDFYHSKWVSRCAAALLALGLGSSQAADDTVDITGYNPVRIFVLNNDAPGTQLSSVTAPQHGRASVAGKAVQYTADEDYVGGDSFSYTSTGSGGGTFTVTLTVAPGSLDATIERRIEQEPAFRDEFVHNLKQQVAEDPEGEVADNLRSAIQQKASEDPWFERRFSAIFRAATQESPVDLYVFLGDDDIQGVTESGDFGGADTAFARQMADRGENPVVLNCGVAGTSLVQWSSLDAPSHLAPPWLEAPRRLDWSRECMDSIDSILDSAPEGTAVRGLLIGLGGSDAVARGGSAPAALITQWPAQLAQLVDLYRSSYGADMTVLLLELPELNRAGGEMTRAWESIRAAQQAFLSYRYQLLTASGLDTWEDDQFRPHLSDAGQRSLANRLVNAFGDPQTPNLGDTAACGVQPCFPDTNQLVEPGVCEQANFFRTGQPRDILCDQYGNSLHAMSAACDGCIELDQIAASLGYGMVSASTAPEFRASNHMRLAVDGSFLTTVPYDNPYTDAEPGACGDQSREAAHFVLPAGSYPYSAEARLAEACSEEETAGCGPLIDPGDAQVDSYQRTLSVGRGTCLRVQLGEPVARVAMAEVETRIFLNCTGGCHGPRGVGNTGIDMDLTEGAAHASIVNVASEQQPSLVRVAPGDPRNSYLMRKVLGIAGTGTRMPPPAAPVSALTATQLQLLTDWIEQGALDN